MYNKIILKYFSFIIWIFVVLFLLSCNSEISNKKIKQGKIEYKINYLDNVREKPLIALLPHKMITVFKNNSTYSVVEGFLFKLVYITNHSKGQNITLFQVLDKKYMYFADTSQTPFGYQVDNDMEIIPTNKEKTIAEYKCKHAYIVIPNQKDTLEVYYTDELGIKDPNCNNPYKKIKGVLMEFTVNMLDINMNFTAQKVKKKKVDSKLFKAPEGYKIISKKEMEDIVEQYNNIPEKK
jgi:hypothetical protein